MGSASAATMEAREARREAKREAKREKIVRAKVAKILEQTKRLESEIEQAHCPQYQAIVRVNKGALHYTNSRNNPLVQHNYLFKPNLQQVKSSADSRALLYLVTSQADRATDRIYYITTPEPDKAQEAKNPE